MQHDWPGNVRELLHAIEARDGRLRRPRDPARAPTGTIARNAARARPAEPAPIATLEAMERAHIELALRATPAIADRRPTAGISERNLYRKLREYDLER